MSLGISPLSVLHQSVLSNVLLLGDFNAAIRLREEAIIPVRFPHFALLLNHFFLLTLLIPASLSHTFYISLSILIYLYIYISLALSLFLSPWYTNTPFSILCSAKKYIACSWLPLGNISRILVFRSKTKIKEDRWLGRRVAWAFVIYGEWLNPLPIWSSVYCVE